jgi:hypothetical protein
MLCYIPRKHDENHWIDDRWLQIVGLFGLAWASLFIVFLILFSFLLHHCEVTLKNNYVICTNIFFIYNSMDTSFHLGVSRFFDWICYFLSFKGISTCLPKLIQIDLYVHLMSLKNSKKIIFRRLWSILGHI